MLDQEEKSNRHEQIPWCWNISALVEQITTRLLRVLNPGTSGPLATEVMQLNGYGHGDSTQQLVTNFKRRTMLCRVLPNKFYRREDNSLLLLLFLIWLLVVLNICYICYIKQKDQNIQKKIGNDQTCYLGIVKKRAFISLP